MDGARISVLVDNEPSEGLCSEWGLALLVECGGGIVLLEFGQSAGEPHYIGVARGMLQRFANIGSSLVGLVAAF